MSTQQYLMDRVGQGSSSNSAAIRVSAQRVMTALELAAVVGEFAKMYRFCQGMRAFADAYRCGQSHVIGTTPYAAMYAVYPVVGAQIPLAPGVVLLGGTLNGGHTSALWEPVAANAVGTFTLQMDGQNVATQSLAGKHVLPYIFRVPEALYKVFGGFLDEFASSILRSDFGNVVVTPATRSTLNKIVSGDLRSVVADIAKTQAGFGRYVLMSGAVSAARLAAEEDALSIAQSSFPVLYEALVLHLGYGTPVI